MTVYSIAIQKGGSGKTSTALCLGAYLHQKGEKVLYIDLDAQRSLSLSLGAKSGEASIFEVLTNSININEAIIETKYGDLIPSSFNLAVADRVINETGQEYKLKEALEGIRGVYDAIIIDTPPHLGILTTNALTCSDVVIIPSQAEIYSLEGLALLNRSIQSVKKYTNKDLQIGGILITRYNARTKFSQKVLEMIENYAQAIDTKVYKAKIRECIAVKEAQALQESIYDYSPNSNASEDYTLFSEEIIKDRK